MTMFDLNQLDELELGLSNDPALDKRLRTALKDASDLRKQSQELRKASRDLAWQSSLSRRVAVRVE